MRNILAYVPQKEKNIFAFVLNEIWLAPIEELARKQAYDVIDTMGEKPALYTARQYRAAYSVFL